MLEGEVDKGTFFDLGLFVGFSLSRPGLSAGDLLGDLEKGPSSDDEDVVGRVRLALTTTRSIGSV